MMLGVQRTSVTSTAIILKKRGLINYSRGQIQVLNREGLEEAACECYEDGNSIIEHTGHHA